MVGKGSFIDYIFYLFIHSFIHIDIEEHIWMSNDNFWESVFPFQHMPSGDQTQIMVLVEEDVFTYLAMKLGQES